VCERERERETERERERQRETETDRDRVPSTLFLLFPKLTAMACSTKQVSYSGLKRSLEVER
jgi:hypothetical protein